MNASRFFIAGIAIASIASALGCAQPAYGPIGDTGRATNPPSSNETPGPSTNTMTAPSASPSYAPDSRRY